MTGLPGNTAGDEAETKPESAKASTVVWRKIYPPLLWYAFWFLLITCVYWPGLIVFPKKDHPIFMLGRFLYDSDLEWFFKTLNYARTRLLQPGDYFAFRPVHMLILSIDDIFFRYSLIAQGVVNSALFSLTATALFYLSKKISGSLFLAIGVTSLWAFQLAGAEILLWQHITPYIILPGLFCAVLLLLDNQKVDKTKLIIAGIAVFLASLIQEIGGIVACTIALIAYFYSPAGHRKIVWPFALGGLVALLLNVMDYFFITKVKSFVGPSDVVDSNSFAAMLSSFLPFTGSIGITTFAPSSVDVFYLSNWFMVWNFVAVPKLLVVSSAIVVVFILSVTAVQTLLSLKKTGITPINMASIFALSLFGSLYGVCAFRIFTRGVDYMFGASYYYSLFSLSISIMVLVAIVRLSKRYITFTALVLLCLLSALHMDTLYSELKNTSYEKNMDYKVIKVSRDKLLHDKSICFAGMDVTSVPDKYNLWTPLYQDVACSDRNRATPVYLSAVNGSPALSVLQYTEEKVLYADLPHPMKEILGYAIAGIPFGHPYEVTLDKVNSPVFLMTTKTGDQLGFSIDYNLIHTIQKKEKKLVNTILWNPGEFKTTYRIAFSHNKIVLYANDILIGILEEISLKNEEPMKLEIFSETDNMVRISNAFISTTPGNSTAVFNPKYIFDVNSGEL